MKLDYMRSVRVCVFPVSNHIGYLWHCSLLFPCVVLVTKPINTPVITDEVMLRTAKWAVCIYNTYCHFLTNIALVTDMHLINKEGISGYDSVDFNRLILLTFAILFRILRGIKEERIRYIVHVYVKWKKKLICLKSNLHWLWLATYGFVNNYIYVTVACPGSNKHGCYLSYK